jgi:hypothetical protein
MAMQKKKEIKVLIQVWSMMRIKKKKKGKKRDNHALSQISKEKINGGGGIQKELSLFFLFSTHKFTIHIHMHILDQKVCLVFPWIHYLTLQYM